MVIPGVVVLIYGAGFLTTWFLAARHWIRHFGRSGNEQIAAGTWGLLVALIWPLYAAGALVGKVASL